MYTVMLVIHTFLALGIVGLVLIQRSDQDGFGLSGGGNSLMSSQAKATFLTRTTAILAALFMASSLLLALLVHRTGDTSPVDDLVAPAAAKAAPVADEAPADETLPVQAPAQPSGEVPLAH